MRTIVEKAGAQWLGVQILPAKFKCPDLVLFNHPISNSTLSLEINKVTKQNIENKLKEHENKLKNATKTQT
jgi:hypothetical protein